MRLAFAFGLLAAGLCWAGPAADARAVARRQEAMELLRQIVRGPGNPQPAISRLQFLGEAAFAANELALRLPAEVEVRKRRTLALALAQLAQPGIAEVVQVLEHALKDEDGAVRMYAAQGLGRVGDGASARKLLPLLNDKTLGVRKEAALSLGALKDPRAGPPLMAAAKAEGEIEVRAMMLAMVGRTGDKAQARALEEFLASDSELTRFGAAQGLCGLGSPRGYEYARRLIASAERSTRLQGLKLFEGSTARAAAPVLAPLLLDADPAVAAVAGRLLYQGGDAKKLDWLVLRSHHTTSVDERMYFEKELEALRLRDDQRREILTRAGIK